MMEQSSEPPTPVVPAGAPAGAAAIARGVARHLGRLGQAVLHEVTIPGGRRLDILALAPDGGLSAIEVKSGPRDFLSDAKWPEYRDWCDRLWFAVDADFPQALIPADVGLLVADAFDSVPVREPPHHPLAPARRRGLLLRFALLAARRLEAARDPQGAREANAGLLDL